MCRRNTGWAIVGLWFVCAATVAAQVPRPDWRRIGNAALDLSLASAGTGPVDRVWYSEDGARLYAHTSSGRTFVTEDFENWTAPAAPAAIPSPAEDFSTAVRPEPNAKVRGPRRSSPKLYALGQFAYKSEDGGRSWANLTAYRGQSIIGGGLSDLAVSPRDDDEITVAAHSGVWRSVDGGMSWTGLNQAMPNLPVKRLLGFPAGTRGLRIAVDENGNLSAFEWMPGEKQAWRASPDADLARDAQMKQQLSQILRAPITAEASAGDYLYAGSADGQLWASADRGRTWRKNPETAAAPIQQIFADLRDGSLALVALGSRLADQPPTSRAPRVIRVLNGGALWDDLTANLPEVAVNGITADKATGAVYIATERGLFMAFEDLLSAAPAAQWTPVGGSLPNARMMDVKLDPAGNQLYIALDGYGVFGTAAPHRVRDIRIVSAADLTARPAAPGSLLSVLGTSVRTAVAGSMPAPVLSASPMKSEIQIPFEISGTSLTLALDAGSDVLRLGVPLQNTSPAILVDSDGSPVLLDADSGVILDAMNPARSNARLQILATGLGRVKPDWPVGTPAPVENPPQVSATVRAYLDRVPVEVTRAVLAPQYIGFYLIEVQLPKLVNYGPAELYIEADGQPSNRVRVYIEP
jgi:uncharacterized protein (TIGR03437 family)